MIYPFTSTLSLVLMHVAIAITGAVTFNTTFVMDIYSDLQMQVTNQMKFKQLYNVSRVIVA